MASRPRFPHNALHIAYTCVLMLIAVAISVIVSQNHSCASETASVNKVDVTRPNLIFIFTDDQRLDAIAASGNSLIRTPNIDRLAARGVRFTNARVVMSLCSPSRAAALTGCYGSRNGVTSLGRPLAPGVVTFASLLQDDGYRTAMVGKWHIKDQPQDVGFDYHCTFYGNGTYHGRAVNDNGTSLKPEQHVDDYCVDRSITFLRDASNAAINDQSQPFVLFHATQLPHMDGRLSWPSQPEVRRTYDDDRMKLPSTWRGDLSGKPPYLAEVRNRTQALIYGYDQPENIRTHIADYYAVITEMDQMLGRLFDELDRLELWQNTWVIFMSDNGWLLGEHGMTSKVLPYESSVRVPMIVAGPGLEHGVEDRIALNIDIAPTLLDLAGLDVPDSMHGRSLKPLLLADTLETSVWRERFVYECINGFGRTRPMLAVIDKRWKLIHVWDDADEIGVRPPAFVELYDLENDPDETHNLADNEQHSAVLNELAIAIEEHIEKML